MKVKVDEKTKLRIILKENAYNPSYSDKHILNSFVSFSLRYFYKNKK